MTDRLVHTIPGIFAPLTVVELCAGAGGQALGLHSAGFHPLAILDNDRNCVATLQENFKGVDVYLEDQ